MVTKKPPWGLGCSYFTANIVKTDAISRISVSKIRENTGRSLLIESHIFYLVTKHLDVFSPKHKKIWGDKELQKRCFLDKQRLGSYS